MKGLGGSVEEGIPVQRMEVLGTTEVVVRVITADEDKGRRKRD